MQGTVYSSIACVERPDIHHEPCADRAERRACRDGRRDCTDEKRVNYPAIKHKEMVSGMVYRNRPVVPAGV